MYIYNRKQIYLLDQCLIDVDKQPAIQLMLKASQCVLDQIQSRCKNLQKLFIIAGSGNNGGDAFALALLAKNAGISVDLFCMGDLNNQSDESRFYRDEWEKSGRQTVPYCSQSLIEATANDVIVDGLFGIGLNKSLSIESQSLISTINKSKAMKVCIDIPSGLNADTGMAMPIAVCSDLTVTFIAHKQGCYIADGPDYCGEIIINNLGASIECVKRQHPNFRFLMPSSIQFPAMRVNNSHKNQFGHVLVVGGEQGMCGAVRLAGYAALRSGAGLVSLCVHPECLLAASQYPEVMVSSWQQLQTEIDKATVIVIGPGLTLSEDSMDIFDILKSVDKPMIIDAGALNQNFVTQLKTKEKVITPHPGEAARLLQKTTTEIQDDRERALKELSSLVQGVTVLKGAGTMIGCENTKHMSLCSHGNSGMATAGMGDVLAGLIAGYIAQGLELVEAAETAVLLHALAAERYARKKGQNNLIATDILRQLPKVIKELAGPEVDG